MLYMATSAYRIVLVELLILSPMRKRRQERHVNVLIFLCI